jgi:hypothetical protein
MFKVLSSYMCWKKYTKCNIWMVAERGRPTYRTHGSQRLMCVFHLLLCVGTSLTAENLNRLLRTRNENYTRSRGKQLRDASFLQRVNWFAGHKIRLSLRTTLGIMERGGIAPLILNLRTRWRSVISFARRPLCPQIAATGIHWIGVWEGPAACLDTL